MRHLVSGRKLKRTHSHRRATLAALSVSLIQHKKIRTTMAKAKEARMFVEKLITRAKNAVAKEAGATMKNVHARREVFAFLRDRGAVSTLFNEIAAKVATRPGGYTRVVKLGRRHGDGAELAMIELVDYSTGQEKQAPKQAAKASKPDTKKRKKEGKAEKEVKKEARKGEAAGVTEKKP
ncbi:MAG: 50S ribosomal protein L17 [Bacteroidota bacterium]